jgi:hypothetical protein
MKIPFHRSTRDPVPQKARLAQVFVLALLLAPALGHASERWATLEAIHQLENPSDTSRPGPCGELGAYQFREQTWRMHTLAPFRRALDRTLSDAVAVKHYDWIKAELLRRGIAVSPYTVALVWNGGIRAVLDPNPAASIADYAARAANIAGELQSRELALAH